MTIVVGKSVTIYQRIITKNLLRNLSFKLFNWETGVNWENKGNTTVNLSTSRAKKIFFFFFISSLRYLCKNKKCKNVILCETH